MRKLTVLSLCLAALLFGCGGDDESTPSRLVGGDAGAGASNGSNTGPTPSSCVSSSEALNHVGQRTTVCGVVSGASYRPDVGGDPTFINFDRPFPNHTFTALIWGDNRGGFSTPPEQTFGAGVNVCVEGLVETFDGEPQIIVTSPAQIEVC